MPCARATFPARRGRSGLCARTRLTRTPTLTARAHRRCELPMTGVKSTSLIFRPQPSDLAPGQAAPRIAGGAVSAGVGGAELAEAEAAAGVVAPFALFCGEDERYGTHLEVYPRPNGVRRAPRAAPWPKLQTSAPSRPPSRTIRPPGEVYVCGIGGSEYVQGTELAAGRFPPGGVGPDAARVAAATAAMRGLSAALGKRPPAEAQACMRPCPPDALPMMGKVPTVDGAFVSAGHNCAAPRGPRPPARRGGEGRGCGGGGVRGPPLPCMPRGRPPNRGAPAPSRAHTRPRARAFCAPIRCPRARAALAGRLAAGWGILWAPVSGLAMAELILDGAASCVDLAPFDPARFARVQARAGRAGARGRKQGQSAVGEQW